MKSELKTVKKKVKKSRSQQRYESLVKNIAESQTKKENLKNDLRKVTPRIEKELWPLVRKRTEATRSRLIRFDALADEIGVGKENEEYFEQYMVEEVMDILHDKDFKDEELTEIYKKYTGESPEVDQSHYAEMARSIKEQFGFDIDLEEMKKKGVEDYMFENAEKFCQQAAEAFEQNEMDDYDHQKPLKVSKKEQILAQDSKAIYMKLMKKFHPDLEQDEQVKIEKTAIVQEITKAYKEKDFFKLLDLQFQYLDNDPEVLSDELLKQFNKMLAKQLAEIKEEIETIKYSSNEIFQDFFDHNSIFSERKFRATKKNLKMEIESIEADTRESFRRKKGWFKSWVRDIRDMSSFDIFDHAFPDFFR